MSAMRVPRIVLRGFLALSATYVVLLIPDLPRQVPHPADKSAFVWNQDARWQNLEDRFGASRRLGCDSISRSVTAALARAADDVADIDATPRDPSDTLFGRIEEDMFSLAPLVGACPSALPRFGTLVARLRESLKNQSKAWDMSSVIVRSRMYRLLYGTRAAYEEIMLQESPGALSSTMHCYDEPSRTPSAQLMNVTVHSGDILVSRGGAPTSALIARGNDFPGNFSHVALLHVDSLSQRISIIESHIEKGVVVSSPGEYLRDTKLRIMVLRLRADLPSMKADPQLPDEAASWALHQARSRHIPYDFSMDFSDSSTWFCSEVASTSYQRFGVRLWMGLSSISSPGLAAWLSAFGVEHFETQEPSDLEYDPQLRVVAEWRDADALFSDHVDNAVIDARLEQAERGEALRYAWYGLPLARVAKGYSVVLQWFGMIGPVPEGMSATTALIHTGFVARHGVMKERVLRSAAQFKESRGYRAPYWELLKFSREAAAE